MKRTLIHIHHTIWITFIFFLMLGALLISVARLATPWLTQQKPLVEKWASTLLGQSVQIDQLAINWDGFEPVLRCDEVIIFNDKRTKPLLRARELDIGINLIRSVFSGSFRLGHLRISGLHLTVVQDKTGHIHINGINTPVANTNNTAGDSDTVNDAINWLFSEPEISLQDVTLTWYDKNNKVLPVKGLNFNIKNSGNSHKVWGQAQLAQMVPSQLAFTIHLTGDWQHQSNLKADVYLKAQDILLQQWLSRINLPSIKVEKGLTNFELWGKWRNKQWQSWQSLFALNDVALTYTKTKTPVSINVNYLGGNIFWQPDNKGGWKLTGDHLQVVLAKQPWEASEFKLAVNSDYTQQQWQISYIDLTSLIPLLIKTQLLPANWQNDLQQLQPKGVLRNTQFHYQAATANTPVNYIFATQFEQFGINRWQKIPGINHLAGQLQLAPDSGNLQIKSQQTRLDFGKLFRAPIALTTLAATVNWQQTPTGIDIKASDITASNPAANVNAKIALSVPKDKSKPFINLQANYQLLSAQHAGDYLPLTQLSPELVKWLDNAIVRIKQATGTLIIDGDMKDYPFDNKKGIFLVDSQIKDADLAYWPKWPILKHSSGELIFKGSSMQALMKSGQIFSSKVKQITASIATLKKGVPAVLKINGQLTGNLNDGLRVLRESPLHDIVKNGVDDLQATGPLQLQLGLIIPLRHGEPIKVNGQIDTKNATLTLPKWNLALPDLQGQLLFTESGLTANNLTATLWQKPVTIQITTLDKQQGMQIQLTGQVAVKSLQQQFNTSLLNALSGGSTYTVTLHVANKNGQDDLHITSDLQGIAVNLPIPLAKAAGATKSFEFITNLNSAQSFNKFKLNYGDLTAGIIKQPSSWMINLQSPMVSGNVIWPSVKKAAIRANLQHLYLTSANTAGSSNLQPQDLPNLYFTCQDFRYNNKILGAVTLNLKTIRDGVSITQLQATSPAFTLNASGNWRGQSGRDQTTLSGVLTSPNIATALDSWGVPVAGFATKNSQIDFALQWRGAPYDPSLAKIKGNMALVLKDGQIKEVGSDNQMKMNMGRVLTFMSWQSIARRLQLDFSDLTQHGYSFNILKGDFILANGNAITENTYLDGPMAKVAVNGRIGLVAQDFDMQLAVTTHLSTSISLLVGLAGGPVVGLATGAASWIANNVFGKEVGKIVTDNYRMTGPWSKPEVTRNSIN